MSSASKIVTVDGKYHVWTRKVGEGPVKMLLLHGGPGCTHEYFECFENYLPSEGIEFYYYDQLGSYYSDQPDDNGLWTVERFREEVEQVRKALGLEKFYLYGNSWGGMLAIEYCLKYQQNLKAVVISNMTASIESYVKHVNELRNRLPKELVDTMRRFESAGEFAAKEYQDLLFEHLYKKHICRVDPWPVPVQRCLEHLAAPVYNTMQGPNEFVVTGNFASWDRWDDLDKIRIPALLLVGGHDTMRVEDIEEMGRRIPAAEVKVCENGSHLAFWDDSERYFGFLLDFVKKIEEDRD